MNRGAIAFADDRDCVYDPASAFATVTDFLPF